MFGNIWSFIKRHRRKIAFVGVLFGGTIFAYKYAKRKLIEFQEKEAVECLKQLRKQHHFDGNQRNCNTTVLSLVPRLRETLCRLLDSDMLTSQLKTKPVNKIEIWEELKILSFTRTIVAIYSSAILSLFLRVQLNILGGYMYLDTLNGRSGKIDITTTSDIQKHYLAMVQYLFEQGLSDLISVVRGAVESSLANTTLKDTMTSAHVRIIVDEVRQSVEGSLQTGCLNAGNCNLGRFIMAPTEIGLPEAGRLTPQEILKVQLENETRDIVQGPDFSMVLKLCLDTSFHWLANRTSEYFKLTSGTNGIVRMAEVSMPFAKVIPIVNGLVHTVLADPPNPVIQELLLRDEVKDFAVNIYDAFCEPTTERVFNR